jgi:Flp pilus assembly protein TadG
MRRLRRRKQNLLWNQRGAAAVEFALLLLPLVLLVTGIIQFGIVFNYYVSITHAAREGVRWAALENPVDFVRTKTIEAAPSLNPALQPTDITVSNPAPSIDDQGEPVTVTVTYAVPINIPLMQTFLGSTFTLVSSATQRIE